MFVPANPLATSDSNAIVVPDKEGKPMVFILSEVVAEALVKKGLSTLGIRMFENQVLAEYVTHKETNNV